MKKFFKKILLALVLIPCAIFAVACKKDPPPEPTQAEINANGFAKLKTVMPAFAAQNGTKTITSDTTIGMSTKVYKTEGTEGTEVTEVTGDDFTELVGVPAEEVNVNEKEREKLTYNATTGEFVRRSYEEDEEHNLVMDPTNYASIKKVGEKYVRYVVNGTSDPQAAYVSADHYEHEFLQDTMWSDVDVEDHVGLTASEFDSFDSMCDYMEEMLTEEMGELDMEGTVDTNFEAKFTEKNNVWTFTVKLVMTGETEEEGQTAEMEVSLSVNIEFTDNGLNSFETNMAIDTAMEVPGEGDVTYDIVSSTTMKMKETYSTTFDSSLSLTAAELATFDGITLENKHTIIGLIDFIDDYASETIYSGAYGDDLDNILDEKIAEYGENVEIKLYRDAARTVEFDYTTEKAPSYELSLYPELIAKEGYAVVIEDRKLRVEDEDGFWVDGNSEQNVRVFAVATDGTYTFLTNVDFMKDYGSCDEYDTEEWTTITLNGEEKAETTTTLTLESGKTYKVVYESLLTETTGGMEDL